MLQYGERLLQVKLNFFGLRPRHEHAYGLRGHQHFVDRALEVVGNRVSVPEQLGVYALYLGLARLLLCYVPQDAPRADRLPGIVLHDPAPHADRDDRPVPGYDLFLVLVRVSAGRHLVAEDLHLQRVPARRRELHVRLLYQLVERVTHHLQERGVRFGYTACGKREDQYSVDAGLEQAPVLLLRVP